MNATCQSSALGLICGRMRPGLIQVLSHMRLLCIVQPHEDSNVVRHLRIWDAVAADIGGPDGDRPREGSHLGQDVNAQLPQPHRVPKPNCSSSSMQTERKEVNVTVVTTEIPVPPTPMSTSGWCVCTLEMIYYPDVNGSCSQLPSSQ